jgi:hypothetical protein
MRERLANWLIWLANRVRGRAYWPSDAHPDTGMFADNYIMAWHKFGEPCHWRLSWAYSPHSAMFIGPNNEVIPVNRSIRDAIETLRRRLDAAERKATGPALPDVRDR